MTAQDDPRSSSSSSVRSASAVKLPSACRCSSPRSQSRWATPALTPLVSVISGPTSVASSVDPGVGTDACHDLAETLQLRLHRVQLRFQHLPKSFGVDAAGKEQLHQQRLAPCDGWCRCAQPGIERREPRRGQVVHLPIGTRGLRHPLLLHQPFGRQVAKGPVNGSLVGRPEVPDRRVKVPLQVVTGERLDGEEAKDGIAQRHAGSGRVVRVC